jgi:phytoene dehydrogenase-like protein
MASEAIARQAVVIGAGIAGLAAAGALSDHFEQVVVLERDPLSDGPVHRLSITHIYWRRQSGAQSIA